MSSSIRSNPSGPAAPPPASPALKMAAWVYIVLALIAVVVLAVLAHGAAYFPIDLSMTLAVQKLASPPLDSLALAIDSVGYVPQIIIVSAVLWLALFLTGHRWESVVSVLALLVEGAVDGVIKLLVRRPRPDVASIHIYRPLGDFTFPSGHVFSFVMVFGIVAYFCWLLMKPGALRAVFFFLLVAIVVIAGPIRIYLGEHWASDVLAGYLLGSLGLLLMIRIYWWGKPRFFVRHARQS